MCWSSYLFFKGHAHASLYEIDTWAFAPPYSRLVRNSAQNARDCESECVPRYMNRENHQTPTLSLNSVRVQVVSFKVCIHCACYDLETVSHCSKENCNANLAVTHLHFPKSPESRRVPLFERSQDDL